MAEDARGFDPNYRGLTSFGSGITAAVIGASGGIGAAFVHHLAADPAVARVHALSRRGDVPAGLADPAKVNPWTLDITDEASIAAAAGTMEGPLHLVIVASGILHQDDLQPEKSWRAMNAPDMAEVLAVNTIGPALAAKHFLPLLPREGKSAFAALSARVGSISDNRIGGWYSYRASKAALNQIIRTLSIELARKYKEALCIGLHPGTVDSALSAPFQSNVSEGKLFTPAFSTACMLAVIDRTPAAQSGACFAWDGQPVPA